MGDCFLCCGVQRNLDSRVALPAVIEQVVGRKSESHVEATGCRRGFLHCEGAMIECRKATVVTIGRGSKAEEAGLMPGDRLEAQAPHLLRCLVNVSVHYFPCRTVRRARQCNAGQWEHERVRPACRHEHFWIHGQGMPPHVRTCLQTLCWLKDSLRNGPCVC